MKKVILCVDDEKIVLDSLRSELKNHFLDEYIVEVAESGEEALELFHDMENDGYDMALIISDYIMPEMKGDDLLREIKQKKPQVYNIMLTGQATIEGVTNAINKAGLYRYIAKPWEINDLLMTVTEALSSYSKDKELEKKQRELEIANENLTKLDSAKSYFLGLLSHELNTPLIGINGYAQLIYDMSEEAEIRSFADGILQSEKRLRKFAEISLMITKIKTDKYETYFYEDSIIELVKQTLEKNKKCINQKNLTIKNSFPDNEIMIRMDPNLIVKVIEYIIENAIKFSPENSAIEIDAVIDNGRLLLKIKDGGPGFSEKYLSNTFGLFSSTEELLNHSEGTGLSLAATKVIMDMHNFGINIRNDNGAVVELIF